MVRIGPALLIALAMLGSSCTGKAEKAPPSSTGEVSSGPQQSPSVAVTDYSSFEGSIEAAGFNVRLRQGERGAFPGRFLGTPGKAVIIDGDEVSAFEFPTDKDLKQVMHGISPRGDQIPTSDGGTVLISWDPPRFYGAGRLLVLYFGDKQRTLAALDRLLGPPFAGS